MRIGLVGVGVVGYATKCMLEAFGHTVIGYDKFKEPYKHSFESLYDTDMILMCLPTPFEKDGIDISALNDFLDKFTEQHYEGVIVNKSTVLPGTTEALNKTYGIGMVHNPEFLTEKEALLDSFKPSKIVIGYDWDNEDSRAGYYVIADLYYSMFGDNALMIETDLKTSEMIKYACNLELATQVSFANEMYEICQLIGAEYHDVKQAMLADPRIGRFKTVTREKGYGGMCFPKDVAAFNKAYKNDIVNATAKVNKRVRRTTK